MNNNLKHKFFGLYIGCKISLNQNRFSEEQEDTIFTLSGVSLKELEELRLIKLEV